MCRFILYVRYYKYHRYEVRFLLIFRGMGVRFYFFSCRYCVSFHRLEILGEQGYIFLLYSEFHRFSLWYQLWTCRATCKHALGTQERWNKSIFLDMKDNEPLSSGLSIGSLCFGGFWADFWCSSLDLSIYCISRPVELGENADRGGTLRLGWWPMWIDDLESMCR